MQRDEFGRFIKGNDVAKGNKGNRRSKWHNKNAVRNWKYARLSGLLESDGTLYLIYKNQSVAVIDHEYYKTDEGKVYLKKEMVEILKERFCFPEKWFMDEDEYTGYQLYITWYTPTRHSYYFLHYQAKEVVITPQTKLSMHDLAGRTFKLHR